MADSGHCKSCGAAIVWARTTAGKAMPLDAVSDRARGNIVVRNERAEVITGAELIAIRAGAEPVYTSHFATCVHASRHRRAG